MKTLNFLSVLVLSIILISITNTSALENDAYTCPMGGAAYGFNGSYGSGMAILSWTISFLLIILIISGIYWFIKNSSSQSKGSKR